MSMHRASAFQTLQYLPQFTLRKVTALPTGFTADLPDSLAAWAARHVTLAAISHLTGGNFLLTP